HAAVGDLERIPGIAGPVRQAIEKYIAQAAAENGAEHAEEQEVIDVDGFPGGARLLRAQARQEPARRERDEIHDSVPVNFEGPETAERADLERDFVEVGIRNH